MIFLVVLLVVWQVSASAVGIPFLLPAPAEVLIRAGELVTQLPFWVTIAFSFGRILGGFVIGMLAGLLLAALMTAVRPLRHLVAPFVKIIRTTPIVCFILLMLLWVPSENLPLFISALMVMPIAWTNAYEGLQSIDEEILDMARVFELTLPTRIRRIYLPAIGTHLMSAASVGMGMAWKSGVTAEVLAQPVFGIGTQVYTAKITLESADIFVWTIAIVVLSLLVERLFDYLSRRYLGRRSS